MLMCKRGTLAEARISKPKAIQWKDRRTAIQVDACIAPIVTALNDAGIATVASCCGHGKRPGIIALEDGRELLVMPDWESSRRLDPLWPDINGDPIQRDESFYADGPTREAL
jgi:hypothetical protein